MSYTVKEIIYTIQGEGAHAGRPCVLCRFSGCNLWTGREEDRAAAICGICDTDFVGTDGPGGGVYQTPGDLAAAIARCWPPSTVHPFVVCTGGEPLLQLDEPLIAALHGREFAIAVETNGTMEPPPGIDWICVSPKAGADRAIHKGDELKLAFPQDGAPPEEFEALDFRYFYLQPIAGADVKRNTDLAIRYCMEHPRWRLSLQIHKWLGLP